MSLSGTFLGRPFSYTFGFVLPDDWSNDSTRLFREPAKLRQVFLIRTHEDLLNYTAIIGELKADRFALKFDGPFAKAHELTPLAFYEAEAVEMGKEAAIYFRELPTAAAERIAKYAAV